MRKTVNEILSEIVKVLKEGGTVLYTTDTFSGKGCEATNPEAVE